MAGTKIKLISIGQRGKILMYDVTVEQHIPGIPGKVRHSGTGHFPLDKVVLLFRNKDMEVNLRFQGGYTQIPRDVLAQKEQLTPSAFLIFLCLRMAAGNSSRAFPSISRIERMAGIARSTVCRALLQIKAMSGILVLLCRKRNKTFAASSYHFTTVLASGQPVMFADVPEPITQQGAAEEKPRRIWNILHTLIVKARTALHNLFLSEGVVPFLANNS